MDNLTNYIFKNTSWLCVGLFVYYFLSAAKVYFLGYVQPLLFNSIETPDLRTKILYKKFVQNFFTSRQLHQSTRSYLFAKNAKDTWQLVDKKKIKWHHDLLDALTALLKPLIVVAIGWAVIKFMIEKRLAYDELKITLGAIQEKIAYIKKFRFINLILEYKNIFILFLVILFIILTRVKSLEDRTKAFKKTISYFIGIVVTLGGLTFFGDDVGASAKNQEKKLKDLDLQIRAIHENIYVGLAETIITTDFNEVAIEDATNYENEKRRLDSLFNNSPDNITHPDAKRYLQNYLSEEKRKFLDSTEFRPTQVNQETVKSKPAFTFPFSHFMNNYYREIETPVNSSASKYWTNPNQWNKKNGWFYEKQAVELKTEILAAASQPSEKITLIAKQILDVVAKELNNALLGIFKWDGINIPKAISSYITADKLKACLAPKLAGLLTRLGNIKSDVAKLMKPCCFKKEGSSDKRIQKIQVENDKIFKKEIAGAEIYQEELIAKEKKAQIERKKAEAVREKELQIAAQREKVAQEAENKIKKLVEKSIDADKAIRNDDLYKMTVNDAINSYKEQIDFDNLDRTQLNKIVRSPKLEPQVLKRALRTSVGRHPGPIVTCPICMGSKLLQLL